MGSLESTVVTLRIFGEDLDPDEITILVGASPTKTFLKGEPRSKRPGSPLLRKSSWHLESYRASPGDLNRQIRELLAQTTDDPVIWRDINSRYEADLFAGLFMYSSNDGLTLEPETLASAGLRGLALGLDIYDAPRGDQD